VSDKAALSDARWNLNPGLRLVMWARRHSRWPATLIVIFPPATCPNRSRKSCGLCFNAVRSLTYSMRAPASASAGSSAAPLSIPRTQDGIQVGLSKLLPSPVTLYLFGQFSRLTSDLQETLFELGVMGLAGLFFGLFRPQAISFGSGHEP
jgi:hypothetical protein